MKIVSASLLFCKTCSEYTMKETCPRCGFRSVSPAPPRFSPEDRYGEYRRRMKLENRNEG